MRAPAALLSLPLLIGAAASIVFVDRFDPGFPFTCAAASLMLLMAAAGWAVQDHAAGCVTAVVAGCLSSGLALGATAARAAYAPPLLGWFDSTAPPGPIVIEGVLQEDAMQTRYGVSIAVRVTHVETAGPGTTPLRFEQQGGVRLSVSGAYAALHAGRWRKGRTVRAPALLRHPAIYLNPGGSDERRALARRGIVLVGSVKSAALVEIVRRGSVVDEAAGAVRAWIRGRLARHAPESRGVAAAVLIGDRSGLSADDERRLQEAGTYHVIAISGGNIAVLAVLGMFACRTLLIGQRAAAVATAAALTFYGVLAGGAASVTRAVIVAVLILAARVMDHRGASPNALAVAALLAVAAAPVTVLDPGFILSFGATLGILLGVPHLVRATGAANGRRLRGIRRAGLACATLFAATLCAEVTLAPIGATLFGRVPFAGLGLNFLAIPAMTLVQLGSLASLGASTLSELLASACGTAVRLASQGLLGSARLVELAPWLTVEVPPPASWLTTLYYAALAGLLVPPIRRRAATVLAAAAGVMLLGPPPASRDAVPPAGMPLRIVILDVGQGDSTAILLPDGRALLVDTGGLAPLNAGDTIESAPAFDVGERVVVPALRALGVRQLEALIVSHADPDHVGGAAGILRRLPARAVWEGVPVPPHPAMRSLADVAVKRGMSWRTVQSGDRERFGAVELRVLHPPPPEWERQRVRNEDSVVLEISIGNVSVVLPGDIGREGEAAILARLEPGRVVVLKAPHHGSATSSTKELLDAWRPAAVVFSCGRDNRFGHPHPAVVERYRAAGTRIFSTAEDGAVFVETDGAKVRVNGWRRGLEGSKSTTF